MHSEILKPVVVLIAWSLVMWVWMMAARMPALRKAGIDMTKLTGGKGSDADRVLPPKAQWPSHNYNHLMEQPTIFYAVALVIALSGTGDGLNAWIAWAYVALRIAHSIVQAVWNRVMVRFQLFALSTLCLFALTLHAAMADHAHVRLAQAHHAHVRGGAALASLAHQLRLLRRRHQPEHRAREIVHADSEHVAQVQEVLVELSTAARQRPVVPQYLLQRDHARRHHRWAPSPPDGAKDAPQ